MNGVITMSADATISKRQQPTFSYEEQKNVVAVLTVLSKFHANLDLLHYFGIAFKLHGISRYICEIVTNSSGYVW